LAQSRSEIVAWVGSNIVPHEGGLRAWLRRTSLPEDEINDIVQEAYVSIARLDSVAHIRNGRNYLFQAAKSAILQKVRRERIVRIDRLTELDALHLADEDPGPERRASGRQELERVRRLIAGLPDRCREIFELRRIQGVPQRDIAARLGLPEHTVEAQAVRGLKLIMRAITREDDMFDDAARQARENGNATTRNG
jgi:RNA polymerase sigma factor (sigma-70 family)